MTPSEKLYAAVRYFEGFGIKDNDTILGAPSKPEAITLKELRDMAEDLWILEDMRDS